MSKQSTLSQNNLSDNSRRIIEGLKASKLAEINSDNTYPDVVGNTFIRKEAAITNGFEDIGMGLFKQAVSESDYGKIWVEKEYVNPSTGSKEMWLVAYVDDEDEIIRQVSNEAIQKGLRKVAYMGNGPDIGMLREKVINALREASRDVEGKDSVGNVLLFIEQFPHNSNLKLNDTEGQSLMQAASEVENGMYDDEILANANAWISLPGYYAAKFAGDQKEMPIAPGIKNKNLTLDETGAGGTAKVTVEFTDVNQGYEFYQGLGQSQMPEANPKEEQMAVEQVGMPAGQSGPAPAQGQTPSPARASSLQKKANLDMFIGNTYKAMDDKDDPDAYEVYFDNNYIELIQNDHIVDQYEYPEPGETAPSKYTGDPGAEVYYNDMDQYLEFIKDDHIVYTLSLRRKILVSSLQKKADEGGYPDAKKGEKVYVEKEDGYYHVFGEDSGHSYGHYTEKEKADAKADSMNKSKTSSQVMGQHYFTPTVGKATNKGMDGIVIIATKVPIGSHRASDSITNPWDLIASAGITRTHQATKFATVYSFVNESGQQVKLNWFKPLPKGRVFLRPDLQTEARVAGYIEMAFEVDDSIAEDIVNQLVDKAEEVEEGNTSGGVEEAFDDGELVDQLFDEVIDVEDDDKKDDKKESSKRTAMPIRVDDTGTLSFTGDEFIHFKEWLLNAIKRGKLDWKDFAEYDDSTLEEVISNIEKANSMKTLSRVMPWVADSDIIMKKFLAERGRTSPVRQRASLNKQASFGDQVEAMEEHMSGEQMPQFLDIVEKYCSKVDPDSELSIKDAVDRLQGADKQAMKTELEALYPNISYAAKKVLAYEFDFANADLNKDTEDMFNGGRFMPSKEENKDYFSYNKERGVDNDMSFNTNEISDSKKMDEKGAPIEDGNEFDPTELSTGIEMEHSEHLSDDDIAQAIAEDHLKEDPEYYTHLKEMEDKYSRASKRASADVASPQWIKDHLPEGYENMNRDEIIYHLIDVAYNLPGNESADISFKDMNAAYTRATRGYDPSKGEKGIKPRPTASALPQGGSPEEQKMYVEDYGRRIKIERPDLTDEVDRILEDYSNANYTSEEVNRQYEKQLEDLMLGVGEGRVPFDNGLSFDNAYTNASKRRASAPPGKEDVVLALKREGKTDEEAFAIAWSQYNKEQGKEASKRTAADISDEIPPASWVNDEPREKSPSAAPSLPQREELKDDPINQNNPPMLYDDSKGSQPSFQTTIDPSTNSVTVRFVKPGDNQEQQQQQQQPQQNNMIDQAIEQAMQPGQQPQQGQPKQQQQPAFGDIDNGVSY